MHPLGLCYLASILLKHRHEVQIFDNCVSELEPEAEVDRVNAFEPRVVGLYATTMGLSAATKIARGLKAKRPGVHVVVGGPHPTALPKLTLEREGSFDFAVSGEGEFTLLELVKALESGGGGFEGIQGLSWRDGGSVRVNPSRTPVASLDELPFPARHLLPPLGFYRPVAMYYRHLPCVHMFTSLGCPFTCTFCQSSRLAPGNLFGKKVRTHSAEYSLAEVEHLIKDFGVREIFIIDDVFNLSKKRVVEFCEGMIRKGFHKKLSWLCNVQVSRPVVDDELFKIMKRAGCWMIMPGFESGDQRILDVIKKGITLEDAARAVALAREAGLVVKGNFILGHPTETKDSVENTIRFAKKLKLHMAGFTMMLPLPGTELYENAREYGSFDPMDFDSITFSGTGSAQVPFVPHGLDADYLRKKVQEAHRRFFLSPGTIARNLGNVRSLDGVRNYWNALSALVIPAA
jgi:anaerobic magnesium-protoporphyrin IX monomethyl ester cyclase